MIIEAGLVKAGLVKTGLVRAIQQINQRYFRRNLGTIDYISHASVTVDRIVMTVSPGAGNGNLGLPTGAPAVTDNVLQTIDFVYSGTISELCKNGANYFQGIMADVEYYFGGVQIHGYDIKSNSDNIPDTIGSNDATVINGLVDDWQLYTQQAGGEWLGPEAASSSTARLPAEYIVGASSYWNFSTAITGRTYRLGADIINNSSASVGWSGLTGVPGVPPFITTAGDNIFVGGDYTATANGSQRVFYNNETGTAEFDNVTIKEVLNVA